MSIATEKINPRNERFMLVRLTPARYIGGTLALVGSGVYTMTFAYPLARLERNGTALTKVSTVANNDEWSHDETTGLLTVKLASAPSASINVLCAFYYLFYTTGMDRIASQTPDDVATQARNWLGLISGSPQTSESYTDSVSGVFSVTASSVMIVNTDGAFGAYLTDNDSFFRKEAAFWICLGSTAHIQSAYVGRIGGVSLDSEKVDITLEDAFINLLQPAYMGDTTLVSVFTTAVGSFPSMLLRDQGFPVRYVVGRSKLRYKTDPPTQLNITVVPGPGFIHASYSIDYENCENAVCTSASTTISGTTNRGWGIARTSSDGFKTLNFGTVSAAFLSKTSVDVGQYYLYQGTNRLLLQITSTGHNLEIGDSFSWSHASVNAGATQYAVVMHTRDSLHPTQPNQIDCMVLSRSSAAAGVNVTTATFNTNQAPAIAIFNPAINRGAYYLCNGLDFSVSVTALASGNKYMSITFTNNFDSNATSNHDTLPYHPDIGSTGSASSFLDPSRHIVSFRVTQTETGTPARHGTVMSSLMTRSGLTVNSASVATANTALAVDCSFTIPNFDELEYGSYLKYSQDLLASTLGYVRYNGNVSYALLAAPAAGSTLDGDILENGQTSLDINYADIVTEIQADNPHLVGTTTAYTLSTSSSAKARYLHGADNRITLRHVLTDITGRLPAILALRAERRANYRFRTATQLLDYSLGDDLTLSTDVVIGGTTRAVKISTLSKGTDGVSAEATDLLGL